MKKAMILAAFLSMPLIAAGEISTRVCLADGNTPLELADPNVPFVYRDIMVGTKLTIIVSSDTGGHWGQDGGGLYVPASDISCGVLSGRDYNDTTDDWAGSRFNAAGKEARVCSWEDKDVIGFDLYGHSSATRGDWFIIDYEALKIGQCRVEFWDYNISWDWPICCHQFSHVPTRDFDDSTKVDFADFAIFASQWLEAGCVDPNWCEGNDLDTDGTVDSNDLALFAEYWLERTQ